LGALRQGTLALDLAELLFQIGEPADIELTLGIYIDAFNSLSTLRLDTYSIHRQLGGALLFQFTYRTCGIVKWQPESRRGQMIIETDIQRAVGAIRYWFDQDPNLFSFVSY